MKHAAWAMLAALLPIASCKGSISGGGTGAPGDPNPGSNPPAGGGGGSTSTPPGVAADCSAASPLMSTRIWRLTHAQMANTLSDDFTFVPPAMANFPDDTRLDGFANRATDLTVSPLLADGYYSAGEQLGAQAVANPAAFGIACPLTQLGAGSCLSSFITSFGQKMWRRPLTPDEITSFASLYATTAAQGEGPAGGVKGVVEAAFLSPNFLHRTELGAAPQAGAIVPLTDFELASELSYTLWDSAPDAALTALATEGKLHDKAVLLGEAKRLFAVTGKASAAMTSFIQQWLFLETLGDSTKDTTLFPQATPAVARSLVEENRQFVNAVIFDPAGDRSFKTLLTGTSGFVNAITAPLYGLKGITGTAFTRQPLDPTQRRGILSLASFMWGHASSDGTSLPGRGSYFRANVLCDQVPLPAGGVPQAGRFAPDDATGREKFAVHADPACAVCHRLFDGIGFAMENYDAIGSFRTTDHGKAIDASGTMPLPSRPSGPDLAFTGFVDLVDKISREPDAYACFASQYLSYTSGASIADLPTCDRTNLSTQFSSAGYRIDALVMNVVGSPRFMNRQN